MAEVTHTYIGRLLAWRMPSVHDDRRFAVREVLPSPYPIELPVSERPLTAVIGNHAIGGMQIRADNFEEFCNSNATTSFIILRQGSIVLERYFGDTSREQPLAVFSVTKSFVSALVGIAVERGLISSIEDLITDYVPELESRGYSGVRLRHLLSMTEGLQYSHSNVPWSGAALAYYAPDRWATVLAKARLSTQPETVWKYNDYSPTILGVALSRAAGRPLTDFTKDVLFDPLGMPHPARWTLDSAECGLENAAAGLYVSARTLAAFGSVYLNGGRSADRQVISSSWVEQSTVMDGNEAGVQRNVQTRFLQVPGMSYKYFWWVKERPDGQHDFMATGNFGQAVWCCPATETVIVRTGRKWGRFGATNWLTLLETLAHSNQEQTDR